MSVTNSLPGANAHFISLNKAIEMTALYRADKETILATGFQAQDILPNSETFNRNAFDALLAADLCAGIRIYYGMDENSKVHAIAVAVNEDNEDILNIVTSPSVATESIIEEGQRCPDLCPPASSLNED
jgi:hypothetical protein